MHPVLRSVWQQHVGTRLTSRGDKTADPEQPWHEAQETREVTTHTSLN